MTLDYKPRSREFYLRKAALAAQTLRACNEKGQFLHANGEMFTNSEFWAWRGTEAQFNAMSRRWVELGVELSSIPIPRLVVPLPY